MGTGLPLGPSRGSGGSSEKVAAGRRWRLRALEIAGASKARVALIAGHSRGWSLDTYDRSGLALEQLREVVEKVSYSGLPSCTEMMSRSPGSMVRAGYGFRRIT